MGALEGKVSVVTGGSTGIGLETVRRLRAEGAEVVAVDLQPPPDMGVRFVRADVGDSSAWDAIVGEAESAFGGLDIAFLNAGVTTGNGDVATVTDEQYRRIMGANVDGVFFGLRAAVPAMERRGGGAGAGCRSPVGGQGHPHQRRVPGHGAHPAGGGRGRGRPGGRRVADDGAGADRRRRAPTGDGHGDGPGLRVPGRAGAHRLPLRRGARPPLTAQPSRASWARTATVRSISAPSP